MTKEEFITKIKDLGFTTPKLDGITEIISAYYLYDDNTFVTLWFGACRGIIFSELKCDPSEVKEALLCNPTGYPTRVEVKSMIDFSQCDSNGECKVEHSLNWNPVNDEKGYYLDKMFDFLIK